MKYIFLLTSLVFVQFSSLFSIPTNQKKQPTLTLNPLKINEINTYFKKPQKQLGAVYNFRGKKTFVIDGDFLIIHTEHETSRISYCVNYNKTYKDDLDNMYLLLENYETPKSKAANLKKLYEKKE